MSARAWRVVDREGRQCGQVKRAAEDAHGLWRKRERWFRWGRPHRIQVATWHDAVQSVGTSGEGTA